MKPVSARDLRPFRDFDSRAFVVSVIVGATVGFFFARPSNQGATSATLTDAGAVFVGAVIVAPTVALIAARRGGHLWTAIVAIPSVFLIGLAIVCSRRKRLPS